MEMSKKIKLWGLLSKSCEEIQVVIKYFTLALQGCISQSFPRLSTARLCRVGCDDIEGPAMIMALGKPQVDCRRMFNSDALLP